MKHLIILFTLFLFSTTCLSDNQQLLEQLDSLIDNINVAEKAKEDYMYKLKMRIPTEKKPETQIALCRQLYDEYYVYQFDSAYVYVIKGKELAERYQMKSELEEFKIYESQIFSISGMYDEATKSLNKIDTIHLSKDLRFLYHQTVYNLLFYKYTSNKNRQLESEGFFEKLDQELSLTAEKAKYNLTSSNKNYNIFLGDYYGHNNLDHGIQFYQKALETADSLDFRNKACAAFYISETMKEEGGEEYEKYLILSCIYDVKGLTRESASIHELANYLYHQSPEEFNRAHKYILYAYRIAKLYKNNLRLVQISESLPEILVTYQNKLNKDNEDLARILQISLALLVVIVIIASLYIKQAILLKKRKRDLAQLNVQLSENNKRLSERNGMISDNNKELTLLNDRLTQTNIRREALAKVYINLCSKYISLLKKYETTVQRKIIAHQEQELLNKIATPDLSKKDATYFLESFDKAFIDLYPTFIDEFNALLRKEYRCYPEQPNELSTELRIFALIRLGVKESSEIANLLFYSPQTIYNYRSATKNKAIDKETFEDEVMKLC